MPVHNLTGAQESNDAQTGDRVSVRKDAYEMAAVQGGARKGVRERGREGVRATRMNFEDSLKISIRSISTECDSEGAC